MGSRSGQNRVYTSRFGRRRFLAGSAAGAGGIGAWALAGCGGDDDDDNGNGNGADPTATTGAGNGESPTPGGDPTQGGGDAINRGGTLRATATLGPSGLDPHIGNSGGDHHYLWTMYDNLIAYNRAGEPDGSISLAESWEVTDETTITLTLREGVTFHDGSVFDSEVVKYNLDRATDPDSLSAVIGQMGVIEETQTPDPNTVVLKLSQPSGALLLNIGDRGGMIMSRQALEEFGEDIIRNPVGTGPFMFDEWVQDSVVRVRKFPEHWRMGADNAPLPYFDGIDFQLIPEAVVQLANFQRGELDTMPLSAANREEIEGNEDYQVTEFQGAAWSGFYFNRTLDPVSNPQVREAIAYAIDRQSIIDAVTFGRSPIGVGPITPAQWAYNPDVQGYTYDPQKARDLLSAAGFEGSLQILSYPPTQQTMELVQAMLGDVGIEVEPVVVEVGTMSNRMWVTQDMPVCLAGFSIRADPDGMIGELYHSQGYYNAGHPENAEMDDLVIRAQQSYDLDERRELYTQVQELGLAQNFGTYFYYSVNAQGSVANLQNADMIFGAEGKQRYNELWFPA